MKHPKEYITELVSSPDYREARSDTSKSPRQALSRVAMKTVGERLEESEYLDVHAQSVRIMGLLEGFIDAQRWIESHDLEDPSLKLEKRAKKLEVIRFNHALREMIDTQPGLQASDLVNFVASAEMILGGPQSSKYVTERVREIVYGMQQEVVTEQAIWEMGGDVLATDEEDDRRGIDIRFAFNDEIYEIDVKASKFGEADKLQKMRGPGPLPFWTGLEDGDLGNSFRANNEQCAKIAQRLRSRVIDVELVEAL